MFPLEGEGVSVRGVDRLDGDEGFAARVDRLFELAAYATAEVERREGLVLAVPGAAAVVGSLAAAYMIYLAYRIATAPTLAEDSGQGSPPSFGGGVFLALANPKAYAAMAALFSGFVLVRERPEVDAAVKTAILLAIGIDEATALADAEGMEHHCSDETLEALARLADRLEQEQR